MIKCIAIDDEPFALQKLGAYIKKVPYLELVAECQSTFEASEILKNENIDAIFCDIQMPDVNGMEFVKSLPVAPIVVFVTAYSDYAVEGYSVDAVAYLLKPYNEDDFAKAADKVRQRYEMLNTASLSSVDADDAIFLKTEYRIVRLQLSDIQYVEGMSEYLKIYAEHREKPIVVLLSMKKLEERLPSNMFMRVHRSYIINLRAILEVNKNRVIMPGEAYIPIGENYREQFNEYISSKFLGK